LDRGRTPFLAVAILLGASQFSLGQETASEPLRDSQHSSANLSSAAAEGSAGRSDTVRLGLQLGCGGGVLCGGGFAPPDCPRIICAPIPEFGAADVEAIPSPAEGQAFVNAAQNGPASSPNSSTDALPDAPEPQTDLAGTGWTFGQQAAGQNQNAQPQQPASGSTQPQQKGAGQNDAAQGTSSSQTSAQQPSGQQSRYEKAQEEVKEQEKQRVVGIVPTFNLTYHHDAVPLSAGQKMNLALRSSFDWFTFAAAFAEAGYHEAANDLSGFSWGAKGYGERVGVAYLDTFDGNVLSTAVFPIIFRQDPRYFRMGQGTVRHRILYSLATNFIAKNDYNGKWSFNYGNIVGNMAAGAVSNLYYPNSNAGFRLTITTSMIQTAEGAAGSIFNEFWPDISRRLLHKDPTHGLDAQAAAEEKAKREQQQSQSPEPPQK